MTAERPDEKFARRLTELLKVYGPREVAVSGRTITYGDATLTVLQVGPARRRGTSPVERQVVGGIPVVRASTAASRAASLAPEHQTRSEALRGEVLRALEEAREGSPSSMLEVVSIEEDSRSGSPRLRVIATSGHAYTVQVDTGRPLHDPDGLDEADRPPRPGDGDDGGAGDRSRPRPPRPLGSLGAEADPGDVRSEDCRG